MAADSVGRDGFVTRHGLYDAAQADAAARVIAAVGEQGLEIVRLSFVDQHGVLRGKSVTASTLAEVMRSGCTMTTTLLAKDTSHRTVYPVWTAGGGFGDAHMTGGGDFVMVPDPDTFKVLPWLERTGWLLCDIYFQDGEPVPFSTRALCRAALARLAAAGYDFVSGLEIEFHVLHLDDAKLAPEHATQPGAAPDTHLVAQGFQYLTESRLDEYEPVTRLLEQGLRELGLPLRSIEAEFGPSQIEFTFQPQDGMATADNTVLFRSAVKQICRRHGYHATFMCRPHGANFFSSGWHLHQSLRARTSGRNAFAAEDGDADNPISPVGRHYLAGVLEHARAACAFTTPTINGYKRFKPFTLAPDGIHWGRDNRGAMLRVIGEAGDAATRIENRVGEPAADPYLYTVSQIASGLAGIESALDPGPPVDTPYDTAAAPLPGNLIESVAALRDSAMFREALGDRFVDYFVTLKEAEIARFFSDVTDWEQREYFSLF